MLRNITELRGYTILATDGHIGTVDDFYFDDEDWTIRYLVVDTGGWLSGRKVLISPLSLGRPDFPGRLLPVSLTKAQVEHSPEMGRTMSHDGSVRVEVLSPDRTAAVRGSAPNSTGDLRDCSCCS